MIAGRITLSARWRFVHRSIGLLTKGNSGMRSGSRLLSSILLVVLLCLGYAVGKTQPAQRPAGNSARALPYCKKLSTRTGIVLLSYALRTRFEVLDSAGVTKLSTMATNTD